MSYEYKEEILLDIGPEPNCNYESESENYYSKIRELEKVYAMAERVSKYLKDLEFLESNLNECLTKAEAFDAIMREWGNERLTKSHILETIQKYYDEYERGGNDNG